ncbi:MAG TPA: sedoheptulose 7-phosphate cyclase, partial [Spirochaetia bacterium]|nr:sedoheptulose 7-phosphate cyclase [Spirochaetia bacterium]
RTGARRFVVVDHNVERHFSREIGAYFSCHDVEARIVPFTAGEDNKSLESYLAILRDLDLFPIHRRDEPIIAIGGGVLTDLVGFVASSYRRGVPHIKVPTTLMGYIDASVGVKTGINFNGHKNRLGSFEPPARVLLDKAFLKTLPRRHLLNGVGEMLKLAIIRDPGLFQLLELHGAASIAACFQDAAGASLLDGAIHGMLEELEPNLFEDSLERKVDFGHTFSYGLETDPGSRLLHGEAVVLDIAVSACIARARGLLSEDDTGRIFRLIRDLGMQLDATILDPRLLWQSVEERTFHRNGLQRVPLPAGIGDCVFVNDIRQEEICAAVRSFPG